MEQNDDSKIIKTVKESSGLDVVDGKITRVPIVEQRSELNGKLHASEGPAQVIKNKETGEVTLVEWWENGQIVASATPTQGLVEGFAVQGAKPLLAQSNGHYSVLNSTQMREIESLSLEQIKETIKQHKITENIGNESPQSLREESEKIVAQTDNPFVQSILAQNDKAPQFITPEPSKAEPVDKKNAELSKVGEAKTQTQIDNTTDVSSNEIEEKKEAPEVIEKYEGSNVDALKNSSEPVMPKIGRAERSSIPASVGANFAFAKANKKALIGAAVIGLVLAGPVGAGAVLLAEYLTKNKFSHSLADDPLYKIGFKFGQLKERLFSRREQSGQDNNLEPTPKFSRGPGM